MNQQQHEWERMVAQALRQLNREREFGIESTYPNAAGVALSSTSADFPRILSHIQQHLGYSRENQEDSAASLELECLSGEHPVHITATANCDGTGGNAGGEIASLISSRTMIRSICSRAASLNSVYWFSSPRGLERLMESCFEDANAEILRYASTYPELAGMATTAVCLVTIGWKICVGWAGDSRFTRVRNGVLTQLTVDHNRAQWLVNQGVLTPEEAHRHPGRSHLTNCLGMREEVFPDVIRDELMPGDLYILTTDGFHEGLTSEQISRACEIHLTPPVTPQSLQTLASDLEAQSLEGYGHDNLTAIFVYVQPRCGANTGSDRDSAAHTTSTLVERNH